MSRSVFLSCLSRINTDAPARDEDLRTISKFPGARIRRDPEPIIYADQKQAQKEWLEHGFRKFRSSRRGLKYLGWKALEKKDAPTITEGTNAFIGICYLRAERKLPLESRHLAVAKIQKLKFLNSVWTEAQILRGLVHENIVDCYGYFAVDPWMEHDDMEEEDTMPEEQSHAGPVPQTAQARRNATQLWIMLEYASGGDLNKEIRRFTNSDIKVMPEAGALYYMKQICAGLKHMHDNRIIHNDFHAGNILLKYKSDNTKICMICDFGYAEILDPTQKITDHTFRVDVCGLPAIAEKMMNDHRKWSPKAQQVCRASQDSGKTHVLDSVDNFLTLPWFKTKAVAPIPKQPTPLLRPEVVEQIGYLPSVDPAGTLSAPVESSERVRLPFATRVSRSIRSIPGRLRSLAESCVPRSQEQGRSSRSSSMTRGPSKLRSSLRSRRSAKPEEMEMQERRLVPESSNDTTTDTDTDTDLEERGAVGGHAYR